ncbi:helix-turn-helix transcriptional regulator [Mycobacterium tuberculosis]|uniref:helix-turn-helix transcriptional regulator n=1 Tax=Mycobacterium tuberculosis TaxID=1773 RepID=UPI0012DEDFFC
MATHPGRCRLRLLLRERKRNQQWLSEVTGIDKYRISYYANNRGLMSLSTAKTIADALNCSIEDLYVWVEKGGGPE